MSLIPVIILFFKIISVNKLMKLWCFLTDSAWFFYYFCQQTVISHFYPVKTVQSCYVRSIIWIKDNSYNDPQIPATQHHQCPQAPLDFMTATIQNTFNLPKPGRKSPQGFPFFPLSHSVVREETTDQDCFIFSNPKSKIYL